MCRAACARRRAVADLRRHHAVRCWQTRSPPASRCRCSASGCRRSSASTTSSVVIDADHAAGDSRTVRPAGHRQAAVRPQPARLPVARRCSPAIQWFLFQDARGPRRCAPSASRRSPRTRSAIRSIAIRYASPCCSAARAPGSAARTSPVAYTPSVGRGHDGGPRLDRAGAGRVRHVEAVARAGRRVPVRRRHAGAVPGAGDGRGRSRRNTCRCCPYCRDDRRAGDHLARRGDDPPECPGLARASRSTRTAPNDELRDISAASRRSRSESADRISTPRRTHDDRYHPQD